MIGLLLQLRWRLLRASASTLAELHHLERDGLGRSTSAAFVRLRLSVIDAADELLKGWARG